MVEEKTPQPAATEENSPAQAFKDEALRPEVGINVSGHKQELQRNFGLLSLCGLGLTSGNVWMALGGSITVAIYNGGPPGVIYEYIAASVFYWIVGASIAELASAIPSSGGAEEEAVYHWATITAGRYGRACGWFAGWWNGLAWLLALASQLQIVAAQAVSMYAVMHDGFETERWQVFVTYILIAWIACFTVLYMNRALPSIELLGGFLVIVGVFVTIVVCAVLPHVTGKGYATNHSVWRDWQNQTGYESDGFVFLLGMLNGAYAVGTPDLITHLAEEVPHPSSNLPKAILAQYTFGFLSGLCYLLAILYPITSLPSVLNSTYLFPLTAIYRQATATSKTATIVLLLLALLPNLVACIGAYVTASRVFWTLARDNATPFSGFFAHVDRGTHNPFRAIVFCAVFATVLGCIYVGSTTAFAAFVGSFVVLSTLSYLAAILPHLLSRRCNITPGWFWMRGAIGFIVNAVSCVYIVVFVVIFCIPFSLPVDAESMNYASLITGGLSLFVLAFWFVRRATYVGPRQVVLDTHILTKDAI
ncbi:MAG: hypothetical protein LQ350_005717 [Teloschistes chrysophthalmus]|nr:MAG: hypothetical protein LQ350_005717 [Niorma chrysophthalma]